MSLISICQIFGAEINHNFAQMLHYLRNTFCTTFLEKIQQFSRWGAELTVVPPLSWLLKRNFIISAVISEQILPDFAHPGQKLKRFLEK